MPAACSKRAPPAITIVQTKPTGNDSSVIAITDASGTSIATNRYDEYGQPQSTNTGRFGYTGQLWLPEIAKSTHYHASYVHPYWVRAMTFPEPGAGLTAAGMGRNSAHAAIDVSDLHACPGILRSADRVPCRRHIHEIERRK